MVLLNRDGSESNSLPSGSEKSGNFTPKDEIMAIRNRFPTKIPVILRRFTWEKDLPHLEKTKYLVPQDISLSQFQMIIRNRLQLHPNKALYLLVDEKSMVSLSSTISEVYHEHAQKDGFLYITYASQEAFGGTTQEMTGNTTEEI